MHFNYCGDMITWSSRDDDGARKCRNWQTSKTKDLVSIALVWVQVPSSALKRFNRMVGSFLCVKVGLERRGRSGSDGSRRSGGAFAPKVGLKGDDSRRRKSHLPLGRLAACRPLDDARPIFRTKKTRYERICICIYNSFIVLLKEFEIKVNEYWLIDNTILKCYHLNIKGVLPVTVAQIIIFSTNAVKLSQGLAAFLCAVFSECVS